MRDYISEIIDYAEEHVGFKLYKLKGIALIIVMGDKRADKYMSSVCDADDLKGIVEFVDRVGYACYISDIRDEETKEATEKDYMLATEKYRAMDDEKKELVADAFTTYAQMKFLKVMGDTGNEGDGAEIIQKIHGVKEEIFRWPINDNSLIGWRQEEIDWVVEAFMPKE